jgi:hypothetical protein
MLGPVDLDDWLDEDELAEILSERPEIGVLRADSGLAALRGWSVADFSLARRFSDGERLEAHEIRRLAQCLGA